jgi:hypothetical protein
MSVLPQEVFDELAKLARIREKPYPFPKVIRNVTVFTSVRQEFETQIASALVATCITVQHISSPKKLTHRRTIAREAKALGGTLGAMRTEEKNILASFLPYHRREAFDDFIVSALDLAKCANDILRLDKTLTPAKALRVFRQAFVSGLLDAAETAGGKLTLNKRHDSGSLVEALALLKPYLPPEISRHLSFSNLVTLRREWAKKHKKKLKDI